MQQVGGGERAAAVGGRLALRRDEAHAIEGQCPLFIKHLVADAVELQPVDHLGLRGRDPPGAGQGDALRCLLPDDRHAKGDRARQPALFVAPRHRRPVGVEGDPPELVDPADRRSGGLPLRQEGAGAAGTVARLGGHDPRRLCAGEADRFFQQHIRAQHALTIWLQHVVFDEHRRHADEVAIASRIAWSLGSIADALRRIARVDRTGVDGGDVTGPFQRRGCRRAEAILQPVSGGAMARVATPAGISEGDVILHVEAVADVAIDVEDRIEAPQQRDDGARFGGVRLGIIAVQIDVAGVALIALLIRAAQRGEVPRAGPFVAIDIEDRHEDEVHPIEQVGLSPHRYVPEQHQPGILAVDLAGVDARLHEDDGTLTGALAGADEHQIAAFARRAERLDRDQWRGGGEPVEPRADLRIARGGGKARAFGGGDPRMVGRDDQPLACASPRQRRRQDRSGGRAWRGGGGGRYGGSGRGRGWDRSRGWRVRSGQCRCCGEKERKHKRSL